MTRHFRTFSLTMTDIQSDPNIVTLARILLRTVNAIQSCNSTTLASLTDITAVGGGINGNTSTNHDNHPNHASSTRIINIVSMYAKYYANVLSMATPLTHMPTATTTHPSNTTEGFNETGGLRGHGISSQMNDNNHDHRHHSLAATTTTATSSSIDAVSYHALSVLSYSVPS